ncbi:hypothetical protein OE88DRAFT_1739299 [Heliocybe sulcata]|uniref:Fungal-type protein kinase domain-containing protein n=1 Tax=Heliocybe sulcata TaxID=5364 RepID=A0A5C3MP82_9AGAM|nr:hypothetical protein OE88DRAFT_1739299 [Heliocybe sulcata]
MTSVPQQLFRDMLGYLVDGGATFTQTAFRDTVPSEDIKKFIQGYHGYKGRWSAVPQAKHPEDICYDEIKLAFLGIINDVLQYFGRLEVRKAIDAEANRIDCPGQDECLSPDIALLGCGTAIGPESELYDHPSYRQCLAAIDIVLWPESSAEHFLMNLAAYACYCFLSQPSRLFVSCLIVSDKTVQLFHLDRAGLMYSSRVDIHEDPQTFVRFLLGVSSLDEKTVGFDTRVYWCNGVQYFRPNPSEDVEYELKLSRAFLREHWIRGRGTTCYKAHHDGKFFFLKFYWHPAERVPESEFLVKAEAAKIATVVRAEWYGAYVKISDIRHGIPLRASQNISNRVYSHILQRYCGYSLGDVSPASEDQFLLVFRDAVVASMELLKIGIIHGDLTPWNIMYHPEGAPDSQGTLIDFDSALYVDEGRMRPSVEPEYTFRSIRLHEEGASAQHGYLDELETLILAEIATRAMDSWEGGADADVLSFKRGLFVTENVKTLEYLQGRGLSQRVLVLFTDLQRFFERQMVQSLRTLDKEKPKDRSEQEKGEGNLMGASSLAAAEKTSEMVYEHAIVAYIKSITTEEGCNKWFTLAAKRHYYELLHYIDRALGSDGERDLKAPPAMTGITNATQSDGG